MATHYETLGVPPDASAEQIRKAYIRRARALHPDRQLGRSPADAQMAEQAMRQVNIAWDVLSDARKKADYDRRARPERGRTTPRATAKPGPVTAPQPRSAPAASIDDSPGDGSVSVWASIPVLVIIGLLLGVLIITAFADNEPPDNRPVVDESAPRLGVDDCFAFIGSDLRARSCSSGIADGVIVDVVPTRGNCPQGSTPLTDPSSELFLCWVRMLPGSTNTVPSR